MSLLAYVRSQWEYLLSVALLLASSGAACAAAVLGQPTLVGPAVLLAFIAYISAMWCADADTWRRIHDEAARRQQRAEVL